MLVGMMSGSAGNWALLFLGKRELECHGVLPRTPDPEQDMSCSLLACFILQSTCIGYALKAMLLQDFWWNSPSLNHVICVTEWGLDWMGLDAPYLSVQLVASIIAVEFWGTWAAGTDGIKAYSRKRTWGSPSPLICHVFTTPRAHSFPRVSSHHWLPPWSNSDYKLLKWRKVACSCSMCSLVSGFMSGHIVLQVSYT